MHKADFRNTHFSYRIEQDGIEQFVVTSGTGGDNQVGSGPLPPGQLQALGPDRSEDYNRLYRMDGTAGSGVRLLNQPVPLTSPR